jgi:ferredoxin-NADP reductase
VTDPPPPTRTWQTATVVALRSETPRARTIRLALDGPSGHLAGQHYVVRLTAPDGYTASRSYSVASAPDGSNELELTVERLADGEVSSFLHDILEVGDTIEVRGPIGGWFVWRGDAPALLVGGGSGVVPLMSMVRLARTEARTDLLHLVASARTPADLLYRDELVGSDGPGAAGPPVTVAYTRSAPPDHPRPLGRVTADDLAPALDALGPTAAVLVCGSAGFADHVTALLAGLSVDTGRIRVERFGPSA